MAIDYRALLTSGVPSYSNSSLPLSDFPVASKKAIFDAVRTVWGHLKAAGSLAGLSEDQITVRIKGALNALRVERPSAVPAFTDATFETVVRGAEVVTHDGSSDSKKPDLVFRRIQRHPGAPLSEYRGMFAECKVVDAKHRVGLYWSNGLIRFVTGEYGWAMPIGMMIAYDGHTSAVAPRLAGSLARATKGKASDPYNTTALPTKAPRYGSAPLVYTSVHDRPWTYQGGGSPGEIRIFHLWLTR